MSLSEKILQLLNTRVIYYKGVPLNALMLPVFDEYSRKDISSKISYLKKKGYIAIEKNSISIASGGKKALRKISQTTFKYFKSPFSKAAQKNLLIIYDIPHLDKSKREWLRRQLKEYGFVMIQKSAWVGPSPLPKEFTLYLKKLNLKNNIKTFKLEKPLL